MTKSVSKLKRKNLYIKKEVTRTITFTCKLPLSFSKTQNRKTPRMSAHWETGGSSRVQTTPADLKLYLGWLGFLISTHVLHMNTLINHEYSRMLHILLSFQYIPVSICLSFYLALRFGGIKQSKGIFLLFLKLLRLVLFLQNSGSKMLFFSCGIMFYFSF